MATSRALFGTAALALLLASSCNKTKEESSTPPDAAPPPAGDAGPDIHANAVVATPVAAEDKINVVASVNNLDDMFSAFKKFGESYTPDSPTDPLATLQAQLLAFGFAPGFLGNIDLSGTHVFSTSFPAQGQGGPDDSDLAGSISVTNGRKVLESTPSAYRPQPLGEGMWEFTQDSLRMLIKEAGKELHFGMSVTDLDKAAKLRGQVSKEGRRIHVRATNIPVDDINPADMLDLPDIKIVRDFTKVVQELEALELQTEIGTKKDFEFVTSAVAPFHKLGLDPLGKPRTSATRVEKALPAGPVFVTSLAYGDPKMLHKIIDATVPMNQIPDQFKDMAGKTIGSVHGILDQVANDVVFALYVDKKGQGTVVVAADVKDEAGTLASLRALNDVAVTAVELQKTIAGGSKDTSFEASFKRGSVKLSGGVKGDKLSIKVPKAFRADLKDVQMFVKKDAVDMTTIVKGGVAVVAIGAGGRDLIAKIAGGIAKPLRDSLGQDAGLIAVRKAMGGCQVCMAGGPNEYLRFRLLLTRDSADEKAASIAAAGKLRELSKLGDFGAMGAGIKVEKDAASFGAVVPQSFLYAERKKVESMLSINEFLSDPMGAIESSGAKR